MKASLEFLPNLCLRWIPATFTDSNFLYVTHINQSLTPLVIARIPFLPSLKLLSKLERDYPASQGDD